MINLCIPEQGIILSVKTLLKELILSLFIPSLLIWFLSFSSLLSSPFVFFPSSSIYFFLSFSFILPETLSHVHSYACLQFALSNCNAKCCLKIKRSLPQNYELVEMNPCGLGGRGGTWRPMTHSCQQARGRLAPHSRNPLLIRASQYLFSFCTRRGNEPHMCTSAIRRITRGTQTHL